MAPRISQSVGAHHSAGWVRMTSETPPSLTKGVGIGVVLVAEKCFCCPIRPNFLK